MTLELIFWADESRELIYVIDIIFGLVKKLKETPFAFEINEYYLSLLKNCQTFLSSSGGSTLPPNMDKVELYFTIPIFNPANNIIVSHEQNKSSFDLKLIGEGSYAYVYKYKDTFYDHPFVLKRAKKRSY